MLHTVRQTLLFGFTFGKDRRDRMAFATANVRIEAGTQCLGAGSLNFYLLLQEREGSYQVRFQDHMRAGIRHQNFRYRAAKAQFRLPGQRWGGGFKQPAFLLIATAIIIPIKIAAFFSSRSSHDQSNDLNLYSRNIGAV